MKIIFYLIIFFSTILFMLISCSSSSEEIKEETKSFDSSYVFDQIPPEDIYKFEKPETKKSIDTIYIIQIGAFSTMDNAREFADFSRLKIRKDIKVDFNQKKNLYVVQIYPSFKTKKDALNLRNELLKFEEYKDAWIIIQEDSN